MDMEARDKILNEISVRTGDDCNETVSALEYEKELVLQRRIIENSISSVASELRTQLMAVMLQAESNSDEVRNLQEKHNKFCIKVEDVMKKTQPLKKDLEMRINTINSLEDVMAYLKTLEHVTTLCDQLKDCNDDENSVALYVELKSYCNTYSLGHRATYFRDLTHFYHNILKDKYTKQYEEVLKTLKWPFSSAMENVTPSKETFIKFNNLTKYLFLIEEPESLKTSPISKDYYDKEPSLPIKLALRPLKKRFTFHFTGSRQTARLDRPEWFLTQTLTWVKDHGPFLKKYVQPIADKLQLKINVEKEFNGGLILLAAHRLLDVMEMHHSAEEIEPGKMDSAFAHTVDETLGFHKEYIAVTGQETNSVLWTLTKAETMVKWLAVEKKYALSKMEEALSSPSWMEPVAAGAGAAVGAALWVPRAADWFISMLKTIEERYVLLPQPGHKLQFLELQIDLIEEWRVRLMQLLTAAQGSIREDSFTGADTGPHPLTAVINCAHHTRQVLLQWAHSLLYLQLYYYRRQFDEFTKRHHGENELSDISQISNKSNRSQRFLDVNALDDLASLVEVERRANKLAQDASGLPQSPVSEDESGAKLCQSDDEAGVWGDAPALLMRLRDIGLYTLSDHIALEFKAAIKDYRSQKWHAMPPTEAMALSVTPSLCRPLAGLCARFHAISTKLPPILSIQVRTHVGCEIDNCFFDELIIGHFWNDGGICQFIHDVRRNLIPIFISPPHLAVPFPVPKVLNACIILDMDYDDARRQYDILEKGSDKTQCLLNNNLTAISRSDALLVLGRRLDLTTKIVKPRPNYQEDDDEFALNGGPSL